MDGKGDVVTGWQNKLQVGDRQRHTGRDAGRGPSEDGRAGVRQELEFGQATNQHPAFRTASLALFFPSCAPLKAQSRSPAFYF